MTENQLIVFVNNNNVNEGTVLIVHVEALGNEPEQQYHAKINFLVNGHVAISEGRIGVHKQIIQGSFTPIVGGVALANIINMEVAP